MSKHYIETHEFLNTFVLDSIIVLKIYPYSLEKIIYIYGFVKTS